MTRLGRTLATFVLTTSAVMFTLPIVWMVTISLGTEAEAVARDPTWWPEAPTLDAYRAIASAPDAPVLRWLLNSFVVATLQTLLVVTTSALAAYALARLHVRGGRAIFAIILATLFVPPVTFLAPNVLTVAWLGWIDQLAAVIVPGAASAFGVFFLRQFFLSLPPELEEAARLDGAGPLRIFWSVILPLSRPALATLAMLTFLASWNDFLWPLSVLVTPERLTLPAGLTQLQGAYTTHYPAIMAGAMFSSAPVLLLFALAERQIVEGIARTGLKG